MSTVLQGQAIKAANAVDARARSEEECGDLERAGYWEQEAKSRPCRFTLRMAEKYRAIAQTIAELK